MGASETTIIGSAAAIGTVATVGTAVRAGRAVGAGGEVVGAGVVVDGVEEGVHAALRPAALIPQVDGGAVGVHAFAGPGGGQGGEDGGECEGLGGSAEELSVQGSVGQPGQVQVAALVRPVRGRRVELLDDPVPDPGRFGDAERASVPGQRGVHG